MAVGGERASAVIWRVVLRPVSPYLRFMSGTTTSHLLPLPLLAAGGAVAFLLAGTIALWAHYGTAVFFETIRAGFIACFG
jgi:hypothetical protein